MFKFGTLISNSCSMYVFTFQNSGGVWFGLGLGFWLVGWGFLVGFVCFVLFILLGWFGGFLFCFVFV